MTAFTHKTSPLPPAALSQASSAWRAASVCLGRTAFLIAAMSACTAWSWRMPSGMAKNPALRSLRQPPKTGPAVAFAAPVPTTFALANGLSVYVIARPQLPLVHATLVVRGGSASDPVGQAGISSLMAEAAKLGTKRRSAQQLAEQMEGLGASLDVHLATEATYLSTQALKHTLPKALDLLADVALTPAFAPSEVARAKAALMADIEQVASSPAASAQVVTRRLVFGDHPFGHFALGSKKSVAPLTAAALAEHHKANFVPANAALVLSGDITEAAARALAEHTFGHWQGEPAPNRARTVVPQPLAPKVALVDRPDAPQAECHLSLLGVSRAAPEYPALVLANAILGGMFNSRINMNLREAKGWTYGAHAALVPMTEGGLFLLSSALRTDVAVEGIEEMLKETDKMSAAEVSGEELKAAKSRHVLSVAGRMETLDQIASQAAELFVYGLPADYWRTFPEQLNKVRTFDVLQASRSLLKSSDLHVAVVGDRTQLEAKLMGLNRGPVELFDAYGSILGALAPHPPAGKDTGAKAAAGKASAASKPAAKPLSPKVK